MQKGSMFNDVMFFIGFIIILVFFVLPQNGVLGPSNTFFGTARDAAGIHWRPVTNAPSSASGATSGYSRSISIGQGNASYTVEAAQEYITIDNQGSDPINISGWSLVNGRGNRSYEMSGNQVTYDSDRATIPKAVGFISSGYSPLQNVILAPGETAIVTTGSIGVRTPYSIVSFKENMCSGYIEDLPQYDFTPSLNASCAPIQNEPGYQNLDAACRNFVSGIASCRAPKIGETDRYTGVTCDNCVNGRPAPSDSCLAYIKAHFTYEGCIENHRNDKDFYSRTWRIYLGRQWEMWGKEAETISLFDQFGKLVASRSY